MAKLRLLFVVLVAVVAWFVAVKLATTPPLPQLDPNPWWGTGEPREQSDNVRPFKINVPKEDVDDLNARLSLPPRVAPSLEGVNFTYGFNSVTLNVILKYWRDNYDWKKREKVLNKLPHFKTRIEGLDIHFLRSTPAPTSGKVVVPLLMVHGWPGTVVEFYDIIPLLTSPHQDSDVVFDVICPSIPGYGFSEAASKTGMNTLAVGQIFVKLMARLGFERFYTQGGDWGSMITSDIATVFPEKVRGAHYNMAVSNTLGTNLKMILGSVLPSGFIMDPKLESNFYPMGEHFGLLMRESGYAHLHATKPDTVGVALNSSPQGLAAYILEKFSSWTHMDNVAKTDGGLLNPDFPISLDALLDNVCVYWFTGTITSSMRLYAESFSPASPAHTLKNIPTSVPTGIAAFPNDLAIVPRNFAAHKFSNIVTYTHPSQAGHFAAMQDPAAMAADLHAFVTAVERQAAPKEDGAGQKNTKKDTAKPKTKSDTSKKDKPKKTK